MPKASLFTPAAAALVVAFLGAPASAEALRCRSFNGNVTCAGPGAASCQTVDGTTVCVGGDGDAVQVFGNGKPSPDVLEGLLGKDHGEDDAAEEDGAAGEDGGAAAWLLAPPRSRRLSIERREPAGGSLSLEREGRKLRLRTDRLSVDLE
jgi:hypothetical protein